MAITKSTHDRSEKKTVAKSEPSPTHTMRTEVVCYGGAKLLHEKKVAHEPSADVLSDFQRESIAHFRANLRDGDGFDNSASVVSAEKNA